MKWFEISQRIRNVVCGLSCSDVPVFLETPSGLTSMDVQDVHLAWDGDGPSLHIVLSGPSENSQGPLTPRAEI